MKPEELETALLYLIQQLLVRPLIWSALGRNELGALLPARPRESRERDSDQSQRPQPQNVTSRSFHVTPRNFCYPTFGPSFAVLVGPNPT